MPIPRILVLLALLLLAGCASTKTLNPQDPLEPLNRSIYKFNDVVDKAVLKPVAQGYKAVVPAPGRTMVTNFFSNLDDVIVLINDLLQFKLVNAFSDSGRLLINTTVGAFGLADAATAVGFEKHNEDFGQTLGVWGVESGPYLVIPLLGPSSVRDGIGLYVDSRPSRIRHINHMRTRNQVTAAKAVNTRANLLDQEKVLDQAVIDRYAFIRDAYLLRRQSLVYDGNPPRTKYDDYEEEDTAPAAPLPSNPTPDKQTPATPAPDKSSLNDSTTTAQPDVTPVPVAAPAVAVADPSAEQPAAEHHTVYHLWLSQHEGIR